MISSLYNLVFHHVTYDGGPDYKNGSLDQIELRALETQVSEFGQCPKMLFTSPHPKKYSNKLTDLPKFSETKISENSFDIEIKENQIEDEQNLKKSVKETKITINGIQHTT